jgi:hypothetical protein
VWIRGQRPVISRSGVYNPAADPIVVVTDEGTAGGSSGREGVLVPATMPIQTDWVKSVLFDRGYLARIRGDAIKVYLVMLEASGGQPDKSVTVSLNQLMRRTRLSCPTVIDGLARLEALGLVVSTTHERGKVKTYYVSDPPSPMELSG